MDPYWQLALTSGLGSALITVVAMQLALIPWRKSARSALDGTRPAPPAFMAWTGWAVFLIPCALFAWMMLRLHA
jgi:hypothetical protein